VTAGLYVAAPIVLEGAEMRRVTENAALIMMLAALPALAQQWDPNKVYDAGPSGTPSAFRYVDSVGDYPGWTIDDSVGSITNDAPSANPGGIGGMEGNFFQLFGSGKEKHRTLNWPFDGNASTRTAILWRIYIPSTPPIDKLPSIQIRTHGLRHHLDFSPNVTDCDPPRPGWVTAEEVEIIGGGKFKPDCSGERYLPMSMGQWHTIRVEVGANGVFEAWVDEEEGLSDVNHVMLQAHKTGDGGYIEIGVRSTVNGTQYWTNYLAWGQQTSTINEIEPLPAAPIEICDNYTDDDGDGYTDCEDPGCACYLGPEDDFASCHNSVDDDNDGLVDCDDPGCAGYCFESGAALCSNDVDDDGDGLTDCADPDCSAETFCVEDNATACENWLDDDGDGLIDCEDPECDAFCAENDTALCTNFLDDDRDGLIDCADPDCLGKGPCTESLVGNCSNGLDDDADGLVDCDDPDCGGEDLCAGDQPQFVLTLVRQIGNWQNGCAPEDCCDSSQQPVCNSAIYFSVYDEYGNPLNDVTLADSMNGVSVLTWDPDGEGGDQQGGHARYENTPYGLQSKPYRFHVSQYQGVAVSSEVTPELHADLPPKYGRSAWQVEFMLKAQRQDTRDFTPTEPAYIFDAVELNELPGNNATLDDDLSGLGDGDFNLGGAGPLIGQTFKANGNRIVSARIEASIGYTLTFQYEVSIHELLNDPPTSLADIGPQIGPTRAGPANMYDSEFWRQMIVWPVDGPDAVEVTPGETYFLRITRADDPGADLNVFVTSPLEDYYPDGRAYRQTAGGDLVNDHPNYDVVGYIVAATYEETDPCLAHDPVFDINDDEHVDSQDYQVFEGCATGPGIPMPAEAPLECQCMDLNGDMAIDQQEFGVFQICLTGPSGTLDPSCDD
jgi:hypothetical protein